MEKPQKGGPLMVFGAAALFATGGLLMKLISWQPLAINGMRSLLSVLLIGCYVLVTKRKLQWNRTVLFGAFCYAGETTTFTLANKMTTAANTIVLQYMAPVWIILIMVLFFRRRPTRRQLVTVALVFLGVVFFFVDSFSGGQPMGDMVAVVSGVFYAVLFMLNSFPNGDALSSVVIGQTATALVLGPMILRETDFSAGNIIGMLLLGFFQVGVAYILFCEGTKRTPPVTSVLIAAVEPILNPLLVALFIGEWLPPMSLAGAVIVIVTVVAYNLLESKKPEPS